MHQLGWVPQGMGLYRAASLTLGSMAQITQISGGKRTGIPQQTSLRASSGAGRLGLGKSWALQPALTPGPLWGSAVSLGCKKAESKGLSKIEYSQDKPRPASLGMTPRAHRQVAGAKGCRQLKKVES